MFDKKIKGVDYEIRIYSLDGISVMWCNEDSIDSVRPMLTILFNESEMIYKIQQFKISTQKKIKEWR